jgi:DNA-binding NarL/FixJ family response regulator
VVVLTSAATPQVCARALQLGARACLSKTAPAAELLQCLLEFARSAQEGEMSCPAGSRCLVESGDFSDGGRRGDA